MYASTTPPVSPNRSPHQNKKQNKKKTWNVGPKSFSTVMIIFSSFFNPGRRIQRGEPPTQNIIPGTWYVSPSPETKGHFSRISDGPSLVQAR